MTTIDLQGTWGLYLDAGRMYKTPPKANDTIHLPDSTAHAGKGTQNLEPNTGYMTDRFYFEGYAWYSRSIFVEESWAEKKLTLFLERTRISTVYIDGVEVGTEDSLCGYHRHDLTGRLTAGEHELTIRVNNTDYPTSGGHMTSPDTQTNWNGILGRMELQVREWQYPENLQITAHTPQQVRVTADILGVAGKAGLAGRSIAAGNGSKADSSIVAGKAGMAGKGSMDSRRGTVENSGMACSSPDNNGGADGSSGVAQVTICRKTGEILHEACYPFENGHLEAVFALKGNDLLWDEYSPNLLQATVKIGTESVSACFGIRKLSHEGRRLLVNDKQVFWRGKHDGLVFPRTGYAPMTVEEWKQVFAVVKEYGINHYRFHTCCPPDAAFAAADEMGIYMEPELPFWGTIAAPDEEGFNEAEQAYLVEEGYRILRDFGNHPSFVMLSMGNELWGSMERINSFLHDYRQADGRHLYTQGSNNFQFCPAVLSEEDVFCGVRLAGDRLFRGSYAMCDAPQGHIQTHAPNSAHNYDDMIAPMQVGEAEAGDGYIEIQYGTGTRRVKAVSGEGALIPQVPVISHEIGQYDFFPDFTELGRYEGSQQPLYLELYRERMKKSGTYDMWKDFYQATGTFAIDCYRREIEAALRSRELSGFQLLDLQDFPGQCVALVGVLNPWLESKGLITPEGWRQFCSDTVILAELNSFVVKEQETVSMPVKLSVCNREAFTGTQLEYRIVCGEQVLTAGQLPVTKGTERLQEVGIVNFTIPALVKPEKVEIVLEIADTAYKNSYTLWAYPQVQVTITEEIITCGEKQIFIARTEEQASAYEADKIPFLYIPHMAEGDVEGTYCTDFWNYPMFRSISESMNRKVPVGTLGLYIHKEDELLQNFPCEYYSTPQWYRLVMHSHCTVLDDKENVRLIVQPIDNVERCHKLGMLYYQGEMPVCTARLWEIAEYPEVQAFAKALLEQICKK